MNLRLIILLSATAILFTPYSVALAEQKENWRQGRIYYRMVCTACHKEAIGKGVSPMSKTIAEWKSYIVANKHDASGKSNPSVKYYTSKEYRNDVQATNKAAEKFIDMPESQLLANVRAFLIHGAKDSDTPARCQ